MSLNSLPAVNHGRSRAGTTIGVSGLRGLRAILRFRRFRSNVPNPTSDTRSPFDTDSRITSITASIARPVSALEAPVRFETSAMSPFLFMVPTPLPHTVSSGEAMVNVGRRGHDGAVRRSALILLALALGAASCSGAKDRELARYYDPEGLFTASLPAANDLSVTPPQTTRGEPDLLSGVISQPPAPSPTPQAGGGIGAGFAQPAATDQTTYEAFVVTTDGFEDLSDMTLYYLTGDPSIDVRAEEPIRIDGAPGRLVVADSTQGGEPASSVAVAFSLGRGGTGYLVAAIFPPGGWGSERPDFLRVVASFDADIPPGLQTIPVAAGSA